MGMKNRQVAVDSPKAEVGEIDTRAPFASVKAAVSLFGEVAFSGDKSGSRKPKPQLAENPLVHETQLHVAHKELYKLKDQLHNAEKTRIQALRELDIAKKTVEVLTRELNAINASKELALKVTEAAKDQSKQLEVSSGESTGKDDAWKQELDSAREQYAVAITELDAAKQELRRIRKDFDASMDAKHLAYQQEAEAKHLSTANAGKASQLSNDIAASQKSLVHVKLAMEQAQQEELKIQSEIETRRKAYRQDFEETEKKLSLLKNEFDPDLTKNLEMKLSDTDAEIGAIQKQMEDAKASELESLTNVTTEMDGAREMLQKVVEEANSLKSLVESLRLELEAVKKEHSDMKEKDKEAESVVADLQEQIAKCKAEIEAAVARESEAGSASHEYTSTLQQLSAEAEASGREAEEMKRSAEELRDESEAAQTALSDAEKKLQAALSDAEEAKAAEARALNQIKELSMKASPSHASSPEKGGARITISAEEHNSLSQKVPQSEKLAEEKVAAAMAQVEATRESENESIKKLEATQKEMEDMAAATDEALKRAEMAESAKNAIESELMRLHEKEATETESYILVDEQSSPSAAVPVEKPEEKAELQKKSSKHHTRKSLLPSLSIIFQRKKSQAGSKSPS